MIALLLLQIWLPIEDVKIALKRINTYCEILKCNKPIVVSFWPDKFMAGSGGSVTRIENGGGCSIHLRREALYRVDWLAHEACHCANDYKVMNGHGWDSSLSKEERNRRENAATSCSQELLEKVERITIH